MLGFGVSGIRVEGLGVSDLRFGALGLWVGGWDLGLWVA